MSEFKEWDGEYEKEFYDVLLPDGEMIKHCWPNAGKMLDVHSGIFTADNQNRMWTRSDGIKVRVSPDHPLDKFRK